MSTLIRTTTMFVLTTVLAATAHAQQAESGVLLISTADTVLVYPTQPPPRGGGWNVLRRPAGGGEYEQLTSAPVRAVPSGAEAARLLGPELELAMAAVQATDPAEMLLRLQGDRVTAGVLSTLSRRVASTLGRVYVDTTAQAGATYEYRIEFVRNNDAPSGATAHGRIRVADAGVSAPEQLEAQAGDNRVDLTWSYAPFARAAQDLVAGFHVYRAEGDATFERITALPLPRTDRQALYRDDAARNGVTYRYALRAVDLAGRESGPSNVVTATPRDVTPPAMVQEVGAVSGDGMVSLAWRMSPDADAVGYHVERAERMRGPFERITAAALPVGTPQYADTGLIGRQQLFYRVVAVDLAGNESRASNPIGVVVEDYTPPAPVTSVRAEVSGKRTLNIRWSASPSPDVAGYFVFRGEDEERLVRLTTSPVADTMVTDTGFVGVGLNPGGRYVVAVAAVDHARNESERVHIVVDVPDDEPPLPPTGFNVRNVGGRLIEATWSASPSLDVAEYVWTRRDPDGREIELGRYPRRTPIQVRDTTAVHAVAYVYSVAAIDSAGNRSTPSVDSVTFRDRNAPTPPRAANAAVVADGVEVRWERVASRDLAGYHVYRSLQPTGVYEQITRAAVTSLTFTDSTGRRGHYYRVRAIDHSGNLSDASPAAQVRQ